MNKKCPCLTDAQACCGCVSMHCDECRKPMQSKYVQGRFCSNCGRPLKAELQSEFEELKKQNEALTINMNAYALGMIALKEQKDILIKNYSECMKDYARAIFAEIERLMLDGEIGGKYPAKVIHPDKYAELKMKYIGEQKGGAE